MQAGETLREFSTEEAWGKTIKVFASQCNKQWKNPTSTISDQTITNLKDHLVGNEVVRVKIPKCMSWLDAYDEPIGDLDMMEDKVDNPSPQSTTKVLPSFKVYTSPVTYPKEVEETIGILMEVEPLEHTKLEDLGLSTCSQDLCLSSRFLALGWLLEEIHVTWAHLEKKQTRLQTYTKSLKDLCKKWLETMSQA
ncbi:hypothetical protein Tco_0806756 [Tanacetum coccineum]